KAEQPAWKRHLVRLGLALLARKAGAFAQGAGAERVEVAVQRVREQLLQRLLLLRSSNAQPAALVGAHAEGQPERLRLIVVFVPRGRGTDEFGRGRRGASGFGCGRGRRFGGRRRGGRPDDVPLDAVAALPDRLRGRAWRVDIGEGGMGNRGPRFALARNQAGVKGGELATHGRQSSLRVRAVRWAPYGGG